MMKGWIKCGLAGALILVASFWGGSVRAAGMALERDAAVPGQLVGQAAALQTDTNLLPLRALPSVVAGRGT
ncbi:hypothetical protein WP2W18E01_07260 [Aeromonas caviae]|jgi:hypothetical protein|uniref:Uncharacterized protein n=2 Tax=Aeromonas caviae TaxID=648 RepID=A0A6S4T2V6_AERCA|nr:hypothetical protein [Aeromonas caviae]UBS66317.1 hypothetical protein LCG53_04650 [Aeromonas caviae]BBQ29144.1 hypothetical protein WP2W18E01_07260 [Aeromonas caviae]